MDDPAVETPSRKAVRSLKMALSLPPFDAVRRSPRIALRSAPGSALSLFPFLWRQQTFQAAIQDLEIRLDGYRLIPVQLENESVERRDH
jgi:hypothetical protein